MIPILRIVHVDNLPGIIASGGIWAPSACPPGVQTTANITHAVIVARRATRRVPVGPGGVLHDYVPFYFGTRSPMLYANHVGAVPTNPDGQRPIVYLEADARAVVEQGLGFAFTDGHAEMAITAFYDDLDRLADLDWDAIRATRWGGPSAPPDLKRRKQAEFLVHRFFPWSLVRRIVVHDPQVRARVLQSVQSAERPVDVDRSWYY